MIRGEALTMRAGGPRTQVPHPGPHRNGRVQQVLCFDRSAAATGLSDRLFLPLYAVGTPSDDSR